jgi:hypothetical protein
VRALNGQWIAVGQNGLILTSPNGQTWTSRASGTTAWLNDVAHAGGRYFICGTQGTVLTSTNATDWSRVFVISGKSLYGLATTGDQLVAVGIEGVILRAGLDLLQPVHIASFLHDECAAAAVDRFAFRGRVDQRVRLETSADLETWTTVGELDFIETEQTFRLEQPPASPGPKRFYRAVTLDP